MCGAGAGGDEEEDMVGAGCRVMKTDPEREVGRGGEVDVENEGVRSRVPEESTLNSQGGGKEKKERKKGWREAAVELKEGKPVRHGV